jgi:Peptidase MA superfamily
MPMRQTKPMPRSLLLALGLLSLLARSLQAQTLPPAVGATPRPGFPGTPRPSGFGAATPAPLGGATPPGGFSGFGSAASSLLQANNPPPPRDVPLVEKKLEELSNQHLSEDGQKALAINPEKWKHAETENFIIHYRRVTEAEKVVREVEYDLWYVASMLAAGKDRYRKKSHIYVFEDEAEWKKFMTVSDNPMKWAVSYAYGDELFLNVRGGGNSGAGTSFDSHTLAHETTHAVVARLYPRKRWPLWLNEGFAEFMGGQSVAARKGQYAKLYQRGLTMADIPIESLTSMEEYPSDPLAIQKLYQTSEKVVRFLMTEGGKERFPKFIDAVLAGQSMQDAVQAVYGDKFKDWATFMKHYERFTK